MTDDPSTAEVEAALSSPLPTDERNVTRRRFLQAAAAAGGVSALPAWLAAEAGASPLGAGDGVVVLLTMSGGNDGLNTVIPMGDGVYHDQRRGLAIPDHAAIDLGRGRGLHPNLPAVAERWRRGDVAIIDGVGIPDVTDLSHFSCMARWMAGTAHAGGVHSGWLGRYLDGLGGQANELRGVNIGTSIPLVAQGRHRQAAGLPGEANGSLKMSRADGVQLRQYEAIEAFANATTGLGDLADAVAANGAQAIDVARRIEPVYGHAAPEEDLAAKLDLAARLINANLGIRFITVSYGDFDSHSGQASMHNARMAELNNGLIRFYQVLDPAFGARTLLLTISEFGRRLRANGSAGTDHGRANTLLAIGSQVKGGFYGTQPSLRNLDRQRNLIPTVDYRSLYTTVLETWLGADPVDVLGGRFENLGFLAPPAPERTTGLLNPVVYDTVFERRAQVIRLYLACFGRLPDREGLDHWTGAMRSGIALSTVADAFTSAPEVAQRYGPLSDADFVDLVYRNVLGRPADAAGRAYWQGRLASGVSRGSVMLGFSESQEFIIRTGTLP